MENDNEWPRDKFDWLEFEKDMETFVDMFSEQMKKEHEVELCSKCKVTVFKNSKKRLESHCFNCGAEL